MNSLVVHPDEGGPHLVARFYVDAEGQREALHDMARRIGAVGDCMSGPFVIWAAAAHADRLDSEPL